MNDKEQLINGIVEIIENYRLGEIDKPDAAHVVRWIAQFDEQARSLILAELNYVLKRTYISKQAVLDFLEKVVKSKKIAGDDLRDFWQTVNFLDIQNRGNSQREMLALIGSVIQDKFSIDIRKCGIGSSTFMYIDDVIFSGGHISNDLINWIENFAPEKALLHVVVIGLHRYGLWNAKNKINESLKKSRKVIEIKYWHLFEFEDRKSEINNTDVLRPKIIPNDESVENYVSTLKYEPVLRTKDTVGNNKFFSGEDGRGVLEQHFLIKGVHVRSICNHFNPYQRPLGNMVLETLGFGSMIVTYRNCPNNAPLVLWAGDPWYPLFPRKTN